MKAARCDAYPSCEHPAWRGSKARVLANLVDREAGEELLMAADPRFSRELDPPLQARPKRRTHRLHNPQSG